jgi:hypothetical protein
LRALQPEARDDYEARARCSTGRTGMARAGAAPSSTTSHACLPRLPLASRVKITAPTTSTAATAVRVDSSPSPTSHASPSAITGLTNA